MPLLPNFMGDRPPVSMRDDPGHLPSFVRLLGVGIALGLIGAWIARGTAIFQSAVDSTVPGAATFYYYTFIRFEPFALYASALFFLVLFLQLRRPDPALPYFSGFLQKKHLPFVIAVVTLVATGVGRFAVDRNFDLCIDECLNDFEVKILDQHHLVATVPEEWRPYADALKVPYQNYHAGQGYWASGFLPGFASLDYLFSQADISWALSPTLAAVSLLLLAAIARRVFPEDAILAANLAILLLAFSPQFLAMAITKFAWTAQLAGSLLWVWLFIQPNRVLFLLTPLLGALLIGLHQPHVHPLIAAPFVLRLFYTKKWKTFAWFTLCYLVGAWAWYQVYGVLRPSALGGDLSNMAFAGPGMILSLVLGLLFGIFHAITFLAWTTPVLLPFLGIFLFTWKRQPAVVQDGFLGAALTFFFYLFFPHPQGHGWGFRYLHAAYGLLALAAAGGAVTLFREGWKVQVTKALIASVAFSVVIQIPYRIHEIRTMVTPLALTWDYIAKQPADFVLIKTNDFWYSWDLIRNDPWLKRKPLVFDAEKLTPAQIDDLRSKGRVQFVGANEVKGFGVILSDPAKAKH
jgi:hypothetical protein